MVLMCSDRSQAIRSLLFILLSCRFSLCSHNLCPTLPNEISANGAFITLFGYALRKAILERHTTRSLLDCSHLCLKNAKCFSFNYQVSLPQNGLCELSEGGISAEQGREGREMLTKMSDFVFVQIVRNDLKPKSCLDHLHAGRRYSGFYKIFDNTGSSFSVFCDLTSAHNAAWTLIMSDKTSEGSSIFKSAPLFKDKPTNENNPNWYAFRLSLSKMKQIRSHSTHWRITCSFQLDGLVYRDYVRAKISVFDPIDFKGGRICKRVEYINVRGHNCSDCDAAWWQLKNEMLHHDSSLARCGFFPSSGAVRSEDNFGLYKNVNSKFRCTNPTKNSTTNHWFGTYLE